MALAVALSACALAANAVELPGTTLRDRASGFSASLFVAPPYEPRGFADGAPPVVAPPIVNATVSKRIGKGLTLGFDVSNVFDRQAPREDWFFQPPQPRGFILRLRKAF
jgi:outer membrane receptor protein involved in Fe transport